MAQAPKIKALDTTKAGDVPDWFSELLPQINSALSDTANALDKQLTPAENLSRQKYVLNFTTGAAVSDSFPQTFTCTLPRAPEDIHIAQKSGTFTGASDVSNWTLRPGNIVVIQEIPGLIASTKYQFVLVLQ